MTWLDGFERKDLGPDGGPFDRHDNPKLLWHTWEGYSWSAAEGAFLRYPPHIAVSLRNRRRVQYVSLDRHAYALAGSDTEDSWVIQIEVAGFAALSQELTDEELNWLGTEVLAPIKEHVPIPDVITPYGFHGAGEGMVLASSRSPIRYPDVRAWDAFSGHVGHQHAPAPDSHWDPGRLNVQAIIDASNSDHPPLLMEDKMISLVLGPDGIGIEFRARNDGMIVLRWQGSPGGGWSDYGYVNQAQPGSFDNVSAFVNKDGRCEIIAWHSAYKSPFRCWQVAKSGAWSDWAAA